MRGNKMLDVSSSDEDPVERPQLTGGLLPNGVKREVIEETSPAEDATEEGRPRTASLKRKLLPPTPKTPAQRRRKTKAPPPAPVESTVQVKEEVVDTVKEEFPATPVEAKVKREAGTVKREQFDLPGQKRATPPEGDPKRKFYESLRGEKPDSEMAKRWCLLHGLLPFEEAAAIAPRNTMMETPSRNRPSKRRGIKTEAPK